MCECHRFHRQKIGKGVFTITEDRELVARVRAARLAKGAIVIRDPDHIQGPGKPRFADPIDDYQVAA